MTVKDFYDNIGGNYASIIVRMKTDDRICKFLKMFLQDKSYETLLQTMSEEKVKEAFLAAHTLKGVVGNMSFQELSEVSVDITEALRSEDMENAKVLLPRVIKEYEKEVELPIGETITFRYDPSIYQEGMTEYKAEEYRTDEYGSVMFKININKLKIETYSP